MRTIMLDERYGALPKMGEKKAFWNTWKAKRAKEEREEARQRLMAAREALMELFEGTEAITPGMRFRDVDRHFREHPVFQAVPERDRKDVYEDAMERRVEKERAAKAAEEKRVQDQLVAFFGQLPTFDFATTWEEAEAAIRAIPAFAESAVAAAERESLLQAWETCSLAAMDRQLQRMAQLRDQQRRADRLARDAFEALLDEMEASGQLHAECTWRGLFPALSKDRRYGGMLGSEGSSALDLFKLRVDDLAERLHGQKKAVKAALADAAFTFDHNTTVEAFLGALAGAAGEGGSLAGVPPINLKFAYESLHHRATEREEERLRQERRRAEKQASAFRRMLRRARDSLSAESTWHASEASFADKDAFREIEDPAVRQQLFEQWIAAGDYKGADSGSEGESRRSSRGRHHRRSRSRSRSPSASGGRWPVGIGPRAPGRRSQLRVCPSSALVLPAAHPLPSCRVDESDESRRRKRKKREKKKSSKSKRRRNGSDDER